MAITSSSPSEFDRLRRSLLKSGQLFEDPDFPCIQSSVFYHESPPFTFCWKRPHEIVSDPKFLMLPEPQNLPTTCSSQPNFESILGRLGDPWFVTSIASLYLTKGLFYRVVPADQSFDSSEYAGIFRFRIWWFGQWQEVLVDDRLPIVGHNKLAFVQAMDGRVFWPALLEKAFAKLHGSYEALKYGTTIECLSDLTGGVTELIDLKSDSTHLLNSRILMQRLLSITCIVTAVSAVDENPPPIHRHQQNQRKSSRNQESREHFVFGDSIPADCERKRYNNNHRQHHQHAIHKSPSSLSSSSSEHSLVHFSSSSSPHPTSSSCPSSPSETFPRLPVSGIIGNSNYRVLCIERVETVVGENREQVFLLKLVNSLGCRSQYNGPFSEISSPDWHSISESDRLRIQAMDDEEEEEESELGYQDFYLKDLKGAHGKRHSFWMEFTEFVRIFTHLEVVYLDAETSRDEPSLRSNRFPMTVKLYRGSWRRGVTAGGCRNNSESFHQNPQIELTLSLESDDMTIICLNQHSVLEPQVVGFSIYNTSGHNQGTSPSLSSSASSSSSSSPLLLPSLPPSEKSVVRQSGGRLDRCFFKRNKSLINSSYSNSRQVLLRCSLNRGSYVLMPTSFEPGFEGAFTIRVYSMKGIKLRLLDHENVMTKSPILKSSTSFDSKFSEYEEMFMQVADEHKSVTAHDLQELLDSSLPNDYVKSCATTDVCRLIISALDHKHSSGRLHFKDYRNIMCSLRFWQNVFKNHTKGTTGILRVEKLEEAIAEIGFILSSDVLSLLVLKFMRKDYTLRFGDFVAVILHLMISFSHFHQRLQSVKRQPQHQSIMQTPHHHILHHTHHMVEHHNNNNQSVVDHSAGPSVSLALTEWLKVSFMT